MRQLYIDKAEGLEELAESLNGSEWIALDTEFICDRTYFPRLCLLQVANSECVACVDPLALPDLGPLWRVLYDPSATKILHAGRQDLEILYLLTEGIPQPVFDTQIAATMLGFGDQISYAALIKELLDVDLDKSHARTDWCQRPLEEEQIRYAADDARYLGPAFLKLHDALEQKGRLAWLKDDFGALTDPGLYQLEESEAWRRIKGASALRGVQLAALRALAAWRELMAREQDKPRRWIVRDDVLLELARRMPNSLERLSKTRGLESSLARRRGNELLECIAAARKEPRDAWPQPEQRSRLSREQEALIDAAMGIVRLRASEHALSPANLVSRKELERMIIGHRDLPSLRGWRKAIVGNDLLAFLDGELSLRTVKGGLTAERMLE